MPGTLIGVEALKTRLDAGEKIRVLDISYSKEKDLYQDYLKAHIPGAQHFNVLRDVQTTPDFPWNIPDADAFQRQSRDLGVDPDTHVVVYDNLGNGGFSLAGRAWWLYRLYGHTSVSLLDGGLEAWTDAGYPTASGTEAVQPGTFTSQFDGRHIRRYDDMVNNMASRKEQVVDSRGEGMFNGKPEDPKSGHYPGAKNVPLATQLVDKEKKRFKTPEQLKEVFANAGVDLSQPVTAMCTSGRGSCSAVLAAVMCGCEDAQLYLGGFTDWKNHSEPANIEQTK